MNQIASSLLILSASICGAAATFRPVNTTNGFGGMLSLVALGLGLWGGMALLTSMTRERDYYDESSRVPLGVTAMNGLRNMAAPMATAPMARPMAQSATDYGSSTARDYRLSPELNAQVSLAAEMKGQTKTDIVEETLRRHLPRYSGTRAAS
jgi:hypothetical protein